MNSKNNIRDKIKSIINDFRSHYNSQYVSIEKINYDSNVSKLIFNWYKNSSPYTNIDNINRFKNNQISGLFIINNSKISFSILQGTKIEDRNKQGIIGIVDGDLNVSGYSGYGNTLMLNKLYYYTTNSDMLDYTGIGYLGGTPEPIKDAIVIKKNNSNITISDESIIRNIPANIKYEFIEE